MPDPTETGCAIHLGDPAVQMVSLAYDKYTQFATQSYSLANNQIGDLSHMDLKPVAFSVNWDFEGAVAGYQRPPAPGPAPDMTFHGPGDLPAPPTASLAPVTLDAAPGAPVNPVPAIRDYPEPAPLTAEPPAGPIDLSPVPTPVRPDMSLPPAPTLRDLDLPDAPTLTFTSFAGSRPQIAIEAPLQTFAFTPEQYTSDLLDRVKQRVGGMLDGGTGLPAAVAQALRDRAWDGVETQEARAVQKATEEFAARGFSEPNGLLVQRLAEVRQNNQNQRNALSRDVYIKDADLTIQNLQFAVTQGIALESRLMQDHADYMRLGLAAAQAAQDVAIKVFDARVELANVALKIYETDAAVWRENLQAELIKLQQYKAELEAAQVKGSLNEQAVKIYNARIDAIRSLAAAYHADVQAATAVADQNKTVVEARRAEIQAYGERVDAYKTEWDAYASKLQSNATRAQLYGLVEQGYATRVGAWSHVQTQKLDQQRMAIAEADLTQRGWDARLRKMTADIDAEKARLAAVSDAYRSRIGLYSAEAAVETAASDANLRQLNAGIARERQRTDVALQNAKMSIDQMLSINQMAIARAEAVAKVSSQLAASSMSAVNFSAGVHSGRSESSSCGTSFNYSGSLDDSEPVT